MKIIIPMTGYGSRFVAVGYKELKPFIRVFNKPIIEWIVKGMYPGEKDFLFICREEHLIQMPNMKEQLLSIAPDAKIFSIKDWIKRGPVCDVLKASELIEDDEPCIINYCDFYADWNWNVFLNDVIDRDCEGCIPCYTGFHPHLLPKKNLYASCLVDDNENLVEIREKFSFATDKSKARHSPGIYYFKTGRILKKYCTELTRHKNYEINGEYYASLPYNFLVKDGLYVWVPCNIKYFCQWGTPEDLKEFQYWMKYIEPLSI